MGNSRRKRIEALKNRPKNTQISESPRKVAPNPEIKHSNPIRQTVEQAAQSSISTLPTELVIEILSRLPINTVGNCICVCKSWYRAIHTPIFSTMQFNRAPKIKTLVVQDRTQYPPNLRLVDFEHDSNDKALIGLNTQFFRLNSSLKFLGSCNGLLCLCVLKENFIGPDIDECVYVCNPFIGEYMALPPPTLAAGNRMGYGFGFDSAANEYKIVRMAFSWVDYRYIQKPRFELMAEVYTIGSRMWRNIGNVPYPIDATSPSSAFVNGALHWMCDNSVTLDFTGLIVSFDVAREEFRVVPHPPGFSHGTSKNFLLDLGVLGGRLCIFDSQFAHDNISIWVMKEYGVEKSWTQQYVIQPDLPLLRVTEELLLSFVMNEKILCLGDGKQLICYDLTKKKVSIPVIKGLPSSFSAIVHEGSLISLRGLGEMMRKSGTSINEVKMDDAAILAGPFGLPVEMENAI